MKNYVQPGVNLTLIAPYALTSGQGFQVGNIFAVASNDAASGAEVVGVTEDVFDLTKAAAVTPAAGGLAYWDNTARNVTTTSTSNKLIGAFTQAALAGDATTRVKLTGQV